MPLVVADVVQLPLTQRTVSGQRDRAGAEATERQSEVSKVVTGVVHVSPSMYQRRRTTPPDRGRAEAARQLQRCRAAERRRRARVRRGALAVHVQLVAMQPTRASCRANQR